MGPTATNKPTALITGASAGLGAEFAHQLAARGHDLVLVARDRGRLQELADTLEQQHPIKVDVLAVDLFDPDARARVELRLAATEEPIGTLVNNAGFGLSGEFDLNPINDEVRQLELLATIPLRLSHAAVGSMIARRAGTIITVTSVAALIPLGSYSAAKAWALSFSRWANAYYRPAGITFTALTPGFVRTEFHQRMGVTRESMAPRFMWLDPQSVVRAALRAADRGRAVSVPSVRYWLLSKIGWLFPMWVLSATARRQRWKA